MKHLDIFLAFLLVVPALTSSVPGGKTELEDKKERHSLVREALESLESYSNNLFARKVTKVKKEIIRNHVLTTLYYKKSSQISLWYENVDQNLHITAFKMCHPIFLLKIS